VQRIVVTLAVATVAVGGFAVASSASIGTRKPVSNPVVRQAHTRIGQLADRLAQLRVRCRTLSCVNKSLTRLATGLKNLSTELANCEHVIAISQYGDYASDPDTGPTTGLDYTVLGTPIENVKQMLVWTCAVT
jgi:hypothetical protein